MGDTDTVTAVWNIVKDTASIMVNGESVSMPAAAFAVPANHQPNELDWADEAEQTIMYTLAWGSIAADWGLSTGTSLRLGATWRYGGRLQGQGRYLHEARLWAILDHSGLGQNFNVTATFGDPYLRAGVGVLTGHVRVTQKFVGMHWEDIQFNAEITGAGGGYIRRM
jgi:hypothetical protein